YVIDRRRQAGKMAWNTSYPAAVVHDYPGWDWFGCSQLAEIVAARYQRLLYRHPLSVCRVMDYRLRLRAGRGLASQVSPAGGGDVSGRHGRYYQCDLSLVIGA